MSSFAAPPTMIRRPDEKYWWDDIPDSVKVDIAPNAEEAKELQKEKVRAGCMLTFFGFIIRVYCFAIGVLMLGYGGWVLYQIAADLGPLSILGKVAAGAFLVLSGLLTIVAETRNRRTMTKCVNTYVFLSNHIARGIFYTVVGGLTFPIDIEISYLGGFGNSKILAGFMVAGGLMNLAYAPFRYKYLRRRDMAAAAPVKLAYGEEIAYGFNITHISQIKTPVGQPEPLVVPSEIEMQSEQQMYEDHTNGATVMEDLSTSKIEKGKGKVTDVQVDIEMANTGVPVM